MGRSVPCSCILTVLSIKIAVLSVIVYFTIPGIPEQPLVDTDNWFGKGEKQKQDDSIVDFEISVPNQTLDDLKHRLQNTRFFEALEGIQWEYGTNAEYLRQLVDYWIHEYDWKAQEKLLNSLPNFQTNIDGLKIHFVHVKPEVKDGQILVPIMFIHGWPGSFYEFYKAIHLLSKESQNGKFAFEIICPSLPGFGFSEAAHKPGLNTIPTAVIFSKLMARLGHESYYVQGGDFGSAVSRAMAVVDKRHVKGIHLNMFPAFAPYGLLSYIAGYFTLPASEHKKVFPLKDYFVGILRESGYFHIQATRPDTVGFGLTNSPAGLAAYIVEKFYICCCGNTNVSSSCLDACFTKDELLTDIMIYWVTNSITSAMRYYKELVSSTEALNNDRIPIDVPSGLAEFPSEPFPPPKSWVLSTFPNNVQYSVMPKGGHFAALEQPELFAKDVVQFVEKVESLPEKVE